jgi:glucose/mannose-6-phosphate isomerase
MELLNNLSGSKQNDIFLALDNMPNHLRLPYCDEMSHNLTEQDGKGINNIVFCGLGGSALAGNLAKNWLYGRLSIPLEVIRGSVLPGYVNEHSLVIISSYSGDTAETLEAYEQASKNNVQIVVITHGGELLMRAEADNCTVLRLPDCHQPRFAVFAGLRALVCALQNMGLIAQLDAARELEDAADFLDEQKMLISPDIDHNNPAKNLAEMVASKQVVIYASPLVSASAYLWKISFNEDAKQLAWYNTYSELDHNELEGWQFPKPNNIVVLQLASQFETETMQHRIAVTTELVADASVTIKNIDLAGATPLQELLYSVVLASFTAGYTAIINGVDPEEVRQVSKLKSKLAKK